MNRLKQIDGGVFLEWMHHPVTSAVAGNLEEEIKNATLKLMAHAKASSDPEVRAAVFELNCLHKYYHLMTEKPEREKDDADGDDGTRSGDAE